MKVKGKKFGKSSNFGKTLKKLQGKRGDKTFGKKKLQA
jgi:hypothetical protein